MSDLSSVSGKRKLRILSYNAGLLRFRAFGVSAFTLFSNPAYASKRFPHICEALEKYEEVDILVIQECYEDKHIARLVQCLKTKYPYHAQISSSSWSPIKFNNGLITFSKHPISNPKLERFVKVSALEQHLANKSNLICDIDIPELGAFTVVHTHTTAGGTTDPNNPDVDSDRESELMQAYDSCVDAKIRGRVPIICGDFNCGPEGEGGAVAASASNFRFIVNKGFRDTFAEFHAAERAAGKPVPDHMATWDPTNYLNVIGSHPHCPCQRCDHILMPTEVNFPTPHSGAYQPDWVVTNAKIEFVDTCVQVDSKIKSTLSDHYGLLIELSEK